MALTSTDATQIENQSSSLSARAIRISTKINVYVSLSTSDEATGNALEAEAVDTLNAIERFLNRSDVRDNTGDLVYGVRITNAVTQARSAKVIAQAALDTVRARLVTTGTLGSIDKIDTDSVGLIASDDKAGREPGAATQTPPLESEFNSLKKITPTNANETQTQRVGGLPSDDLAGTKFDEDRARSTGGNLVGQGDIKYPGAFEQDIQAKLNSLASMATYTYQLSIYLMTPEQFSTMSAEETKSVAGLSLLMQSGGSGGGGLEADLNGATRNRHFDLDYFIEDLEMESLMPRAVRGATNQTRLNFKIVEPYGFTFIERLKNATRDISESTSDFIKQHYLMVIRFHGYDDEGNQISSQPAVDSTGIDNNRSDKNSVNEKFIPFKFSNITTRATTGAVEYVCEALPVNHFEALSQKRATIPFQVEIKGQTLQNLFMGTSDLEVDTKTSKRAISTGLMDALNKQQKEYVKTKSQSIADEYKVTFVGSNMGSQKVMPPGDVAKPRTASSPSTTSSLLTNSKGQVEKETFTVSVTAGQQLQQSIDGILKTSQYITNQQTMQYNVVKKEWQTKAGNPVLAWYKITTKLESKGYDKIRKDFAYKIEFVITPQQVTDTKSPAFPKDRFRGVHKKFNYWFTGENTEVLDYEVEFNALYYTSLSPNFSNESRESQQLAADEASFEQASGAVGPPDQSSQNGVGESADEAARAASVLYSPVDFARMEMTILGDPDFIQQGDIFYRAGKNFSPFLNDGSLNYDSQEVFCEVNYNTIEDYNEETGEAKPKEILLKSVDQYVRTNTKGLIYQIISVKNKFIKGTFTQELEGLMVEFPDRSSVTVGNVKQSNNIESKTKTEASTFPKIFSTRDD